MNEKVTTKTH